MKKLIINNLQAIVKKTLAEFIASAGLLAPISVPTWILAATVVPRVNY